MTPRDYRAIAAAFATLNELFVKMADEAEEQTGTAPGQIYITRSGAAKMLGRSKEFIRQRILDGSLTEYPAGLKISEVLAFAAGKPAGAPSKEYRIEGLRTRARKGAAQ